MARSVIDGYLAELDAGLNGSRRVRRAILAEVADGLGEAADRHRGVGVSAREAGLAAVAEFGDPALVSAGFAPLLSARRVHRYGLGYIAAGPVIGVCWITGALRGCFAAVPLPLTVLGIALFALAAAVAGSCACAATAATGRAGRWVRMDPAQAARALLVTAVGALLIDGSLLAMLMVLLARSPHGVGCLPVALGAAVSAGRVCYAATSVVRLGADRAAAGVRPAGLPCD